MNEIDYNARLYEKMKAGQIPGLATASGAVQNPQSYLRMAFYL